MQKISAHTLKRNLPFIHVIAILKGHTAIFTQVGAFLVTAITDCHLHQITANSDFKFNHVSVEQIWA